MLGLVLSNNIVLLFIMWELTSVTSFILISFKGVKSEAARLGGLQALIITGGGGLALFAGLVLLSLATGDINGTGFSPELTTILKTKDLTHHAWFPAIAILIFLGSFTKSAQFPFHFWLPGGMSAPTPASAFLHSATMVKAGIYLLLRLYPVLGKDDLWTYTVTIVGVTTMTIAAILSVKQRDLKGLLAYSTVSKLGAIVALIGLPDYIGIKAALVGIMAHALYKAALFLTVGTVDHATGTRVIDDLGGIARKMPFTAAIAVISSLSMAGVPFFMGFLAKETLLAAALHSPWVAAITGAVVVASTFTATAAYIMIWDVYFRKPEHDVHIHHPMHPAIDIGPGLLALGSLSLGFLLEPLIIPILEASITKEFELYLFHGVNTEFIISMGIIIAGFGLFMIRNSWLKLPDFPLSGAAVYRGTLGLLDDLGDIALRFQSGRVRFYLASILGVVGTVLIASGILVDLTRGEDLFQKLFDDFELTDVAALEIMLLVMVIGSAIGSIVSKRHLIAVLALSVMGYGVAGLFLVRLAPDVAFVQFMVETLSTVLVIVIIGRSSAAQRLKVMQRLFSTGEASGNTKLGLYRDILIAGVIGFAVFIFTATALVNRPERSSIAEWYLDHAAKEVKVDDIVSGVLTDFRGMDTLIEIGVFSVAGMGILSLLSMSREQEKANSEDKTATVELSAIQVKQNIISTPFTRLMATFILPFALYMAITQTLYGSYGPGDGFTGGVTAGLGVAAWYMVFGFERTMNTLKWLHPIRLLVIGFSMTIINASWPLLFGEAFLSFHKWEAFEIAGLSLSTTLVFEIGIALTVFGSVSVMLAAIAHPTEVETLNQGVAVREGTQDILEDV